MEQNYDYEAIGRHFNMFANFWKDEKTNEYISVDRIGKIVVLLAIALNILIWKSIFN